jgi:DNA repair protein RadC
VVREKKIRETAHDALRNRCIVRGCERLGDVELLSVVLGKSGCRTSGAIAQELIDRYGGLAGVGGAQFEELVGYRGIGPAAAVRIRASFELGRRCILAGKEHSIKKISSPGDVAELMIPEMRELDREHFNAILLDTKNAIIRIVTVAVGSLNAALVHPREIFKAAVRASAAGIILVHNHPTGNPEPSREDEDLTVRFSRCGDLMGIDLIDHVIIGGDRFVSMRERGLAAG